MAKKNKGRFFTSDDAAGVWLMYETHTGVTLALGVFAKGTPTAEILKQATSDESAKVPHGTREEAHGND